MDAEELAALVVRLLGDSTSFVKSMGDAQVSVDAVTAHVAEGAKRIEAIGASLQSFARSSLGILGMFGLATSLTGAFNKFADFEKTMVRLTAAVEANGHSVVSTMSDYQSFALELQRLTLTGLPTTMMMLRQAEAMGVSGDAAKRAVTNAVALAAASNGDAASMMRLSLMMEQGNLHVARRALGLQGVKSETELAAKATQRLASGWQMAQAELNTASGGITKLQGLLGTLTREIGENIAQVVKPVTFFLTQLVGGLNRLSPDSRRLAGQIALVTLAVVAFGPAVTTLTFVFGPLVTVIGLVVTVLGALTSTTGLVIAAVALLGVNIVSALGQWGSIADWFAEQWSALKDHVQPAIDGIVSAIKGGEIGLAFEILWTQVKLSFMTATASLREVWYDFTYVIKQTFLDMSNALISRWEGTTDRIARSIIDAQKFFGAVSDDEAAAQKAIIDQNARQASEALKAAYDALSREATDAHSAAVQKIKTDLLDLELDRDALAQQARDAEEAARKASKIPPPQLPPAKMEIKILPKFDAAEFGSAEAQSRIQEFKDRIQLQVQHARGENLKDTGAAAPKATATEAASAEGSDRIARDQLTVLKEMKDALLKSLAGPKTEIKPAAL